MDAVQNPVKRKYNRAIHSEDFPLAQKEDLDISMDQQIVHGEALANPVNDAKSKFMQDLAFNEEPVTIIIEENTRSDFPETMVPVTVNGEGAELLMEGKWVRAGWLPIGKEITTKRKYVEVLARSKSDSIRTVHDDATVERPRNTVQRRTSANYPISILRDDNPRGRDWLATIRMTH